MSAGILSQISFAKETTWGTAVTPTKSIAVRPTGGISHKEDIQMIPAIKGQLQRYYEAIKGKAEYSGDYTFDLFADYVGYFLLMALGSDSVSTHSGESVVYDHALSESSSKPSFTIEQAISEAVYRFAGCMSSGFKIDAKVGEMLQFTPSLMAKTQATATKISGAFTTVPAFNFAQLAVKIGGSTVGEVENIEVEYKNGLQFIYALGSNEPAFSAIEGGSEITIKADLYLDNTSLTELTNYIAKTTRSIELVATGSSIGTASNYVFDLLVPKAVYTTGEVKVSDNHNLLSLEANGIYDTATSKLLSVTLTNLLSSAY